MQFFNQKVPFKKYLLQLIRDCYWTAKAVKKQGETFHPLFMNQSYFFKEGEFAPIVGPFIFLLMTQSELIFDID